MKRVITQRTPPEVRSCRLRNPSCVGTRPPSTSTPHGPLLGPPLGDPVGEVGEPREKRLLTATWMMEAFHDASCPLDDIVGLIPVECSSRASAGLQGQYQPAFWSCNQRRTRCPSLAAPAVVVT